MNTLLRRELGRESLIAVLALTGIVIHLIARYAVHADPIVWLVPLYITLAIGGLPLLYDLTRKMAAHEFGADLLAGISIVVSVLLGEFLVGAIVILMLSGRTALEEYATQRASAVLEAMAKRMPRVAHRVSNSTVLDIDLDSVKIGDTLVVLPHEICPVDG